MADTNAARIRNAEQLTDELVERARAIAPAIAARAEASERNRRVADETIADVAEAGLFEIMVPQRYGGHELGISSMVKVMKVLSPLDVSTGWTLAFYMVHNWMWCLLPEEAQEEIFADGPSRLGPVMVAPTVKARPVEGVTASMDVQSGAPAPPMRNGAWSLALSKKNRPSLSKASPRARLPSACSPCPGARPNWKTPGARPAWPQRPAMT
jgi:hypothetical protein